MAEGINLKRTGKKLGLIFLGMVDLFIDFHVDQGDGIQNQGLYGPLCRIIGLDGDHIPGHLVMERNQSGRFGIRKPN